MNYQIQIKKVYKVNYSFFSDNSSKFLNSYFISRKKSLLQIDKILKKKILNNIKTNDDLTFFKLNDIYQKYLSKKIISKRDISYIKKLYQKFEIFLRLKKRYNKNFIKITNVETNERSYILLHELINNLDIVPLCKINCQLKLNDKLYFYNIQKLDYFFLKMLKKNIKNEIKKVKKITK